MMCHKNLQLNIALNAIASYNVNEVRFLKVYNRRSQNEKCKYSHNCRDQYLNSDDDNFGRYQDSQLNSRCRIQLSAPLAVAICAAFGFRKYIICGCLSSLIGLVLGTQNLLNVAIAMQFRLIVGLILWIGKNRMWSILISGPIASAIARITIGLSFGKMVIPMLVMAVPGMIFTVIVSPIFYSILHRLPRLATTLKVKQG